MKIALYHGYELSGSGSNEYTRSLAAGLARRGHRVILACSEPDATVLPAIDTVVEYATDGRPLSTTEAGPDSPGVTLHRLPSTAVLPVYLTDKQRAGSVKAFADLTDAELEAYRAAMVHTLRSVLLLEQPRVLHVNHLVLQPTVAAAVCPAAGVPYYVVPHGSAIEYTVKADPRYVALAREGLEHAAGVVWISREVRQRVLALFPTLGDHLASCGHDIGIGTDTAGFRPLPVAQRAAARATLRREHRAGGKTPEQRSELFTAIEAGDVDATRRYWSAYDHHVEDTDLPQRLERLPVDADIIAFVGALTWGKGVHSLVAAMPQLVALRPDAHLLIIGSGTYREALEALAHCLHTGDRATLARIVERGRQLDRDGKPGPLEDVAAYARQHDALLFGLAGRAWNHIHFVGRLDHPRLAKLLPWAKVAVFPSIIKEASPLVFAEALACGVLPAASDHSGFRVGLEDLEGALGEALTSRMRLPAEGQRRIEAIAVQVAELLERMDPGLARRLRPIAVERYDWGAVVARIEALAVSLASVTKINSFT